MKRQLCPPMTQEQINAAIAHWNDANYNERLSILITINVMRMLYKQSTLDAIQALSASKAVTEDDLTEEIVNSICGRIEYFKGLKNLSN